jgi:hypothetical protein
MQDCIAARPAELVQSGEENAGALDLPQGTARHLARIDVWARKSHTSLSLRQERQELTHAVEVLQGTLDLLILKSLSLEPLHGWGITNRLQQMSRDAFQIGQGSLYPALHRYEIAVG